MAEDLRGDRLAASEHIVLVLRLVTQPNGEVLYGEVMNAAASAADRGRRFVGMAGIEMAVRSCVSDLVHQNEQTGTEEMPVGPDRTEHGPVG